MRSQYWVPEGLSTESRSSKRYLSTGRAIGGEGERGGEGEEGGEGGRGSGGEKGGEGEREEAEGEKKRCATSPSSAPSTLELLAPALPPPLIVGPSVTALTGGALGCSASSVTRPAGGALRASDTAPCDDQR
eukprot:1883269-Rhodomonas_salina.1